MKILFKNKTKYNTQTYRNFLEFHQRIYGTRYRIIILCAIMVILFLVIMQLTYKKITLAVGIILVVILAFLIELKHNADTVKNELDSKKIKNEDIFSFIFYDKWIKIRENNDLNKIYYMKYYKIRRVYETNDYIYIYINKTHALVLNKSYFVIGTAENFSEFIKRKCIFRYKKIS